MYLTERFAKLVTGTSYADIPAAGVARAKDCILDCLGVTIAGSAESISAPVMQYVHAVGGANDATLVGIGGRTSVTNAALANGVFGHVLDYDDTNQIFIGHVSRAEDGTGGEVQRRILAGDYIAARAPRAA